MKGVVVRLDGKKSIVLFNNGKIGRILNPPQCRVGMIVDVRHNRKRIFLAAVIALVLAALFLCAKYLYFSPVGYLQITYEQGEHFKVAVELEYNRLGRVVDTRPLHTKTFSPLGEMDVHGKRIDEAYKEVSLAIISALPRDAETWADVRIAQDDLEATTEISQCLGSLTGEIRKHAASVNVEFKLYTLELYREIVMKAATSRNDPDRRHQEDDYDYDDDDDDD
ncbi:MAG: hypothetical protein LBK44_02365 [Spirochaetales bacterium]|jgi:hypothetical protein|nr:hypothetical protein [Spirochaetales bacterium]